MSNETETSIECLRRLQRRQFDISRKEKRYQASTVNRTGAVPESSNIVSLAAAVKRKKGVNQDLLEELSQALGQSHQNATTFLQTDGALQALCSFLTGGCSALQLPTAFCIVNLALWEDERKETSLLTNINGAYLITLLGSGNPAMQEACCWALSNLLPQGRTILISQGIVASLIGLFASPSPDVSTAAVQCITHLLRTSSETLKDLSDIAGALPQLLASPNVDVTSCAWLISVLSTHERYPRIISECRLSTWTLQEIQKQLGEGEKVVITVPLVRCMSNACATSNECLLQYLDESSFISVVLQLLNSSYECILKETFLLVANIVNNCEPALQVRPSFLYFKFQCEKSMERALSLF